MKNVFVLCTGRCGSTTFAKATGHATNVTSGHETRAHLIGAERLAYPANHVEADNRLSWMLGRLERKWGDDAVYVHLTRDRMATAQSFVSRAGHGIMRAYRRDIILGRPKLKAGISDLDFTLDYIDTVTSNIEAFLSRRRRHMHVRLENAVADYATFWHWAGLEGNLDAALAEWQTTHNATRAAPVPHAATASGKGTAQIDVR